MFAIEMTIIIRKCVQYDRDRLLFIPNLFLVENSIYLSLYVFYLILEGG